MIDGIQKVGGHCDTVVVGSDEMAGYALAALAELELDYHVIADDEISSSRVWVTSQKDLEKLSGRDSN